MVGVLQPLGKQFAIVNDDGTPTEYFIRWAQQRQIDISGGITAAQAQQLIEDWSAARDIVAGVALDGGGSLAADVAIDHADSAVTPDTYGDATHVPQLTVDQQGHVTAVTEVAISGGGGGGGQAATVIQRAYSRATGNVTVTLPSAPTTGSRLYIFCTGWRANRSISGWYRLSQDDGQLRTDQGYSIFTKISDGTETSVTVTSTGDFSNVAYYECGSDTDRFVFNAFKLDVNSGNFWFESFNAPWGPALQIFMGEHDTTTNFSFTGTPFTNFTTFTAGSNHRGFIGEASSTPAMIAGSLASASNPFAIQMWIGRP